MSLRRRLAKRAIRKGNFGGTARTIGNQYKMMRASEPETSRQDTLRQIVDFRNAILPYSAEQGKRLYSKAMRDPTLTDFVMEIVLAEADTEARELGESLPLAREVIEEELEKLGLAEERNLMPLHVAAQEGNLSRVEAEIAKGADVNLRDKAVGWTALGHAASKGHTNVVQFLLEHGAEANYRDSGGGVPLHFAALMGRANVVKLLLAHGADVNAKGGSGLQGDTALHLAAGSGRREVAVLLLKHGADLDALDDVGATPLDIAETAGEVEMAEFLRKHTGGR